MKKSLFLVGLTAIVAAFAAALFNSAPARAQGQGAVPPAAAPAKQPAGGRKGGGGRARGGANLGPLPEIHAAIPNTLPGLLGKPLKWKSTGPLVSPVNDATHFVHSIKDPTIAFIDGKWEIYATAHVITGPAAARGGNGGTFNMIHVSFADWKDAPTAKLTYMDTIPNFAPT